MTFKNATLIILLLGMTIVVPVFAADSTPSAAVKDKLQALQSEITSKAAKLKTEISKKLTNKAYVGVIKSKSATTLTLAGRSGTRLVNINQDTVYVPAASNPTKKGGITEQDSIATLGDVDENGVLTARQVVYLPQPKSDQPQTPKIILWGQIVSISDNLMTIVDKSGKNIAVSIAKIDTNVATDQFVIVTGFLGKNDIINAQFIHILPQKGKPKIATSSAESSKSASPSAVKKK